MIGVAGLVSLVIMKEGKEVVGYIILMRKGDCKTRRK